MTVTVTGSNFTRIRAVKFGTTAGTKLRVVSAGKLTVVAPRHAAGTVHIRVTTASGTSAATTRNNFTYQLAPAITSVSPKSGPTNGGTLVTVHGSHFAAIKSVRFGSTAGSGVRLISGTELTVRAPAHGAGTVDVRVVTAGGTSRVIAADRYGYVAVHKPVNVFGTITSNTTWSPAHASAYIITGPVTVKLGVTLTIAPGTLVESNTPRLIVDGSLVAIGTATSPITFTVNASQTGSWNGIASAGAGSLDVEHAKINLTTASAVLAGGTGKLIIKNDVIANPFGDGVISNAAPTPVITGNTFTAPEGTAVGVSKTVTPTVQGNAVSKAPAETPSFAVQGSALNPALLSGNSASGGPTYFELAGTVGTTGTLPALGIPWEVGEFDTQLAGGSSCLDIPAGLTLTVQPGAKFLGEGGGGDDKQFCPNAANTAISVEGSLVAVGTATNKINFTALSSQPTAGEWYGIGSSGAGSIDIEDANVNYANLAVAAIGTGTLKVKNDVFTNEASGGVESDGLAAPVISGNKFTSPQGSAIVVTGAQTPAVQDNAVSQPTQGQPAFAVDGSAIDPSLLSGDTVTGGASTFALAGAIGTNGTLSASPVPWETGSYFDTANPPGPSCLDIPVNVTLTISAGAVLKSGFGTGGGSALCPAPSSVTAATISVEGTLDAEGGIAQGSQITFTSINDSSVGGDTESGSSPSAGDWPGISSDGPGTITIDNARIDYAWTAVTANGSGGLTLDNDRFDTELSGAVAAEGPKSPSVQNNTMNDVGAPAVAISLADTPTVLNDTVTGQGSGAAFEVDGAKLDVSKIGGDTAPSGTTFDLAGQIWQSGTLPALGIPWEVGEFDAGTLTGTSCLDVPAGVTLTVAPGAVVKGTGGGGSGSGCPGSGDGAINVEGSLAAVGTQASPITFTSLNDTVGGDTGSGTPSAGDWSGIAISGSGVADIENATVEYAATGVAAPSGAVAFRGTLTNNTTDVSACNWASGDCAVDAAYTTWSSGGPFGGSSLSCGAMTVSPWLPGNNTARLFTSGNCDGSQDPDVGLIDASGSYDASVESQNTQCHNGDQNACQVVQTAQSCLSTQYTAIGKTAPFPLPALGGDVVVAAGSWLQSLETSSVGSLSAVATFAANVHQAANTVNSVATAYTSCTP